MGKKVNLNYFVNENEIYNNKNALTIKNIENIEKFKKK